MLLPRALMSRGSKFTQDCLDRTAVSIAATILFLLATGCVDAENWPVWRGPRGDGTSLETNIPIQWTSTSNVIWRIEVPGRGHASPIVFGDHLFTVSALPESEERVLLALDCGTGKLLWTQTVLLAP